MTPEAFASLNILDVEVDATLPVKLMVHAVTGKLWPELNEALVGIGVQLTPETWRGRNLRENTIGLSDEKEDLFKRLPHGLSLLNCHLYSPARRRDWDEPSVVIVGNTVDDFCAYYTLLRMRSHVHWLPLSLLTSYEEKVAKKGNNYISYEEEEILVTELAHHLNHQTQFDRPSSKVVLCSMSTTPAEIERIGAVLSAARWVDTGHDLKAKMSVTSDFMALLPMPIRLYERHNVDRLNRELFHEGESINYLNTPRPHTFKTLHPYEHRWMTELRLENYILPPRAELGPGFTILHKNYSTEQIRVSTNGFVYFCPNIGYFGGDLDAVLVRPKLRLQQPFQIFTTVFESVGLNIRLSDKGNYHIESVNKFDSLESLSRFLKDPEHRALLDLFLDERQSTPTTGAFVQDRRYVDFVAANEILQDSERTSELLSDLVVRQILRRGLVLYCERCRNADWYSIDDVGHAFTCSRCRKTEPYKRAHWKSPHEPAWYYSLDEVFYQGSRHNMAVPILALDYLQRSANDSFFYSPELDVRKDATAKKADLELDFCCCVDGQLMIGQATARDSLADTAGKEEERLAVNRDIASAIRAGRLILSTLNDVWSARTVTAAQKVFRESDIQVQFLTKTDLLS